MKNGNRHPSANVIFHGRPTYEFIQDAVGHVEGGWGGAPVWNRHSTSSDAGWKPTQSILGVPIELPGAMRRSRSRIAGLVLLTVGVVHLSAQPSPNYLNDTAPVAVTRFYQIPPARVRVSEVSVVDQAFARAVRVEVMEVAPEYWRLGATFPTVSAIQQGDALRLSVWARPSGSTTTGRFRFKFQDPPARISLLFSTSPA